VLQSPPFTLDRKESPHMNRAVVVTGAGSGTGRTNARRLVERGWQGVLSDKNIEATEAAAETLDTSSG